MALARRVQVVRIVDTFDDPQPAAVVPVHADRFDNIGLGGEQLHFKSGRDDHVLQGLLRRNRQLHLIPFAVAAARSCRRIEGDFRIDVLEGFQRRAAGRLASGDQLFIRYYPADAGVDQAMKTGVAPHAVIVTASRVEVHAALAVLADPGPRFAVVAFDALHQDDAVLDCAGDGRTFRPRPRISWTPCIAGWSGLTILVLKTPVLWLWN